MPPTHTPLACAGSPMTSPIKFALALILFTICSRSHAVINGRQVSVEEPVAGNTVLIACLGKIGAAERVLFTSSGVIVNKNFILTAAHTFFYCQHPVSGRSARKVRWEMRFGIDGKEAAPVIVPFSRADLLNRQAGRFRQLLAVKHPRFRDYVFIRIPGGVPPHFSPMKFHADPTRIPLGEPVFVSGYGIVGKNRNDLRLRTAQLNLTSTQSTHPGIMPLAPSTNRYDRRFYLDAYSASQHPCFGDSGAPIYVLENGNALLIGIQTQIQSNLTGRGYCDAPVIGLRADGYADEMNVIEKSFEARR